MIRKNIFSKNLQSARISEIVKLMSLISKEKDIISFAVGMLANEALPIKEIEKASNEVLQHEGNKALQYGPVQGSMLDTLQTMLQKQGISAEKENILVITGSIQGAFLTAAGFIDPRDTIITESPTYSINLETFRLHRPKIIGISLDEKGVRIDDLLKKLSELKKDNIHPKFLYTIPDFQNPTGISMDIERRKKLIELAKEFKVLILEDSPYYFLRYEGEKKPTLKELGGDHVIYVGSFSKVFSTGIRVGYLVAHKKIIQKFKLIKQGIDFCTPVLNQLLIKKLIDTKFIEKQIKIVCDIHRKKLNIMLDALGKYMPEGIEWTRPQGGIFLWVQLPEEIDCDELLKRAVERKVAFTPGNAFFPENIPKNSNLRLNFTYPPEDKIEIGIEILAQVIRDY